MTEPMLLGDYIKSKRVRRGMSRRELGELSGVSTAMIVKVERNNAKPSMPVMKLIQQALRLNLRWDGNILVLPDGSQHTLAPSHKIRVKKTPLLVGTDGEVFDASYVRQSLVEMIMEADNEKLAALYVVLL